MNQIKLLITFLIFPLWGYSQSVSDLGFLTAKPPLYVDSIHIKEAIEFNDTSQIKEYVIVNRELFRTKHLIKSGSIDYHEGLIDTLYAKVKDSTKLEKVIPLFMERNATIPIDSTRLFLATVDSLTVNTLIGTLNDYNCVNPVDVLDALNYDSLYFAKNKQLILSKHFQNTSKRRKKKVTKLLNDYSKIRNAARYIYHNLHEYYHMDIQIILYTKQRKFSIIGNKFTPYLLAWRINEAYRNYNPVISICIAELLKEESMFTDYFCEESYLSSLFWWFNEIYVTKRHE